MELTVYSYGDPEADTLLVQMVDDHDMQLIENEVALIRDLSGGQDFCLKAVKVNSWNQDLSPWPAPAVFGDEAFGEGAAGTLAFVLKEVIVRETEGTAFMVREEKEISGLECAENPGSRTAAAAPPRRVFLGGYSLAGLFALWAGYQTDIFNGIAAASPSIWFPHFTDYMRENKIKTEAIYLSLGEREERTRHPLMSHVGNEIRTGYDLLKSSGKDCVLEWNKGNHFKNPDLRTAKAFAWLMLREGSRRQSQL